jgi:hypothetical protein
VIWQGDENESKRVIRRLEREREIKYYIRKKRDEIDLIGALGVRLVGRVGQDDGELLPAVHRFLDCHLTK